MADTRDDRTSSFELRDYFRIIWLRKWTAILVLALVVGGVMVLSYRETPIYQSTVKLIPPTPPSNVGGVIGVPRGIDLATESAIATSEEVAAKVAHALKITDIPSQNLLRFIKVAPLKAGLVLVFTADHPNPAKAQALAQEFAVQYLQLHMSTTLAPFIQARLAARAELNHANHELSLLPAPSPTESKTVTAQRDHWLADAQAAAQQISTEAQVISNIRASAKTAIIQNARLPKTPIRPNHLRDGIFAAVVGLALGIGAGFLRDYVDDSIRGPEDLERQAGAPLIGVIPHVSTKSNGAKEGRDAKERKKRRRSKDETPAPLPAAREYLVAGQDPKAPATESYRTLRTNLLFMSVGGPVGRLLITSPIKGEGKTTTAANLATVMALAGQRVLVVGADLRRPSIHKFFGLSNRVGLSSVLSGQAALMEAIQDPGIKGLRVMAGGPVPPNPAELLGSGAMKQFLIQASEAADWVILDGPPVLGLADASVLASLSDAVVMVVNEATNRRVLSHARDQLAKVHGRLIGAVLNNFGPATSYYYYSEYYAYTSQYYYEQQQPDGKSGGLLRRRRERADASGNGLVSLPEQAPTDLKT